MTKYRAGLDVGSTTAKMAVLDDSGALVFWRYERHHARVKDLLRQYLADLRQQVGDATLSLSVTGSVGMATADVLQAQFVQEVVAATAYAQARHPEARTLIDIGGEDSKVVLFEGGHTELRMNGNCAGGTGAFIDQMAALLGIDNQELSDLAMQATTVHAIAARCGVFAKTDVQSLISRNIPRPDIAASIFHSIAVQTVTTLAHGCDLHTPMLLCGGPLTFLPALRKAFAQYLHVADDELIISSHSNLIPAMGSAIKSGTTVASIGELQHRLETGRQVKVGSRLEPLFASAAEHEAWAREKARYRAPVVPMRQGLEQVVIGIDSGSTTTKVIALRPTTGEILFTHYAQSLGDPIGAALNGLNRLQRQAQESGTELQVVGSCSTGYGEQLIKAALNLDSGIIETMAHYQAARRLMPQVSFILDIGGQDMKAIFVDQGVVVRMELNEACSSGCGTFLQTFAQSLGYEIGDFAAEACTAPAPCDLGTRCTVFMNSKIKQVLREGASVADISAGLSYSVVNNCLYKVLKLKDVSELGQHIVVQGGTMRNDAVVRAIEKITGCTVARSNMPEMMGALGCALHAAQHQSAPRTLQDLMDTARFTTRALQCHGCENQCAITSYRFASGNTYYSGNKCERVFNNSGRGTRKGNNIYVEKYHLLFDRADGQQPSQEPGGKRRIGIPRALGLYEDFPFWHTLLTECGFEVVLSRKSNMKAYEADLRSVMSDNICFPAKLTHSHITDLMAQGVERILFPYVVFERQEDRTSINSYNCPIVSGYSDVVRSSMRLSVPIDSPAINLGNEKLLEKEITEYLATLGIPARQARQALQAALREQDAYEQAVQRRAQEIYDSALKQGHLLLVLAGRPYHTDPLVQHRLSEMVAGMGVDVVSEDIVRHRQAPEGLRTNIVRQWAYVNRIIRTAQWVATQPASVQLVELTSFGCGPDSFLQDEVREALHQHGKALTLLKIDDVSNLGSLKLRVRSLIESLQQQGQIKAQDHPFSTTRTFTPQDRDRTILCPNISEFISPFLKPIVKLACYNLQVLPQSDEQSANLGLRYANNEVCYPATLVVGDIIKALQSGKYDLSKTAVAMTQTGGQCRATNYAGLIKRAMAAAGFQDVPLITVGVSDHAGKANEQEGFDVPWRKIIPVLFDTLIYSDVMSKFFYSAVGRELHKGDAARMRDRYISAGVDCLNQGTARGLKTLVKQAAADFNSIVRQGVKLPRVGVVGEIFLKFNHFSHQHVTQQLIDHGVEVMPPLITPFFTHGFVNSVNNERLHLRKAKAPIPVMKALYSLVQRRINQFNKAASAYSYYVPMADIRQEAKGVQGIVSPAAQFGEGWLLPAEIVSFAKNGVKNVISLQPFGCIANHIVAKGVEKVLRQRFPDLNLLSIDFDSGVSQVNVTNRLFLFLDNLTA